MGLAEGVTVRKVGNKNEVGVKKENEKLQTRKMYTNIQRNRKIKGKKTTELLQRKI